MEETTTRSKRYQVRLHMLFHLLKYCTCIIRLNTPRNTTLTLHITLRPNDISSLSLSLSLSFFHKLQHWFQSSWFFPYPPKAHNICNLGHRLYKMSSSIVES